MTNVAKELLEKNKSESQPQETPAVEKLDARAMMRFKCVKLIAENGSEMDKRNPIPKATEIYNWVVREGEGQ